MTTPPTAEAWQVAARCLPRIQRLALRLAYTTGGPVGVDDLVQEGCIAAARAVTAHGERSTSVETYVVGRAMAAMRRWAAKHRGPVVMPLKMHATPQAVGMVDVPAPHGLHGAAEWAILERRLLMWGDAAASLVLAWARGETDESIAAREGSTRQAVHKRRVKAIARLRRMMGVQG